MQVSGARARTAALRDPGRWRAAVEGPEHRTTRAIGFGLVGASGIVVNQVFLGFFVDVAGVGLVLGAVLASQMSTIWNFILLELLVFPGRVRGRAMLGRFIGYDIVNMSTLVIRIPALVIGAEWLGLNYLVVNFVVLVGLFFVRYLLAESWIWRHGGSRLIRAADDLDDEPEAVEA